MLKKSAKQQLKQTGKKQQQKRRGIDFFQAPPYRVSYAGLQVLHLYPQSRPLHFTTCHAATAPYLPVCTADCRQSTVLRLSSAVATFEWILFSLFMQIYDCSKDDAPQLCPLPAAAVVALSFWPFYGLTADADAEIYCQLERQ